MTEGVADVAKILRTIPELGFVSLRNGSVTFTSPLVNLHTRLCGPVIAYLQTYSAVRRFSGDFFLCLYDGWREYSKPFEKPTFVRWKEVDSSRFQGTGSMGEPRFIHLHDDGVFPTLPLPVLSFCRHHGDPSVLLIPDWQFLSDGFRWFTRQVDSHDIAWDRKNGDTLFWRGAARRVRDFGGARSRDVVTSITSDRVDAKYASDVPVSDFLRHKYILDIDGMVSAWSGLYWRLWSNSLPVKLSSHWEQWYYPMLTNRENIVVSGDDLISTYEWLVANDELARQIAGRGQVLARRLTYAFAIEEYKIG